jgi:hypothetical protein
MRNGDEAYDDGVLTSDIPGRTSYLGVCIQELCCRFCAAGLWV